MGCPGYETTNQGIAERGYEITGPEISEFRKSDGGSSCLSPRLPRLTL
jgi:N-dimethylarginine dimethylaminohydrolase